LNNGKKKVFKKKKTLGFFPPPLTEHSTQFGHRSFHPYIHNPILVNHNSELITPPLNSFSETNRWLQCDSWCCTKTISKDEIYLADEYAVVLSWRIYLYLLANLDSGKRCSYRKHI